MSKTLKTFYILHGTDDWSMEQEALAFRERMNATPNGDLNTSTFDGQESSVAEILNAARSYPFLADKRLVLVKGLLAWVTRKGAGETGKKALEDLLNELPHLPEWARVVFIERGELPESHKVLKLAHSTPTGQVVLFKAPTDLSGWITRRAAEAYGAEIEPNAAAALAEVCAGDTRRADHELLKLVSYVGEGQRIPEVAVGELTAHVAEAEVFKMVDALADGKGQVALTMLHGLLSRKDEDPFKIYGMIIRQFRLLLTGKEYIALHGANAKAMASALGMAPYVAGKITTQSRGFTLAQLDRIYRALLETDLKMKTGQLEAELALDLLVASLS